MGIQGRTQRPALATRLHLVALVALVLAASFPSAARADETVGEGRSALPGLVHTRIAQERPRGVAVRAGTAYGLTESIGNAPGVHHRGTLTLGVSGQPLRWLGIGLSLDARADTHPVDRNPRAGGREAHGAIEVRATPELGAGFAVGGSATALIYGNVSGGVAGKATSLELTGLWSYRYEGFLAAGELGYRVDRSDASVKNQVFGASDQLSLGVSSFDAVLFRLSGAYTLGSRDFFIEYALDGLVGRGAPGFTRFPMYVDFGLRQRFGSTMALDAYVDFDVSARPSIPVAGAYVRIDPRFTVGAAFSYRFSGRTQSESVADASDESPDDDSAPDATDEAAADSSADVATESTEVAAVPEARSLEGVLRDANGMPVVDAHLALTIADVTTIDAYTDAEGRFRIEGIPPGFAELRIEAVGLETRSLVLGAGSLVMPEDALRLAPAAASGLLRGTVLGFEDEAVQANVTIMPGNRTAAVDGEGHFEVALEPGSYGVRIEAAGYASQTRTVRLANATVTILHVELRRLR